MRYLLSSFFLENFPVLNTLIFGMPAWYWASILFALAISCIIGSFFKKPLGHLVAFLSRQSDAAHKSLFIEKLDGPIQVFATLVSFLVLSFFIKEPDKVDDTLSIAIKLALFVSISYLFYCLIDLGFTRLIRTNQSPRSRIGLVLPLGRRVAKTSLVIIAFLVLLSQFGVDVSALLLGLGLGGLALGLAVQPILANLFGGAVLSLDQPFQVGDYCKCGDILGYVEEIGVRSTRIRTLDRTLITIPNSKLSEMHIENYMEREKIRFYTVLRVDLSTRVAKLQELLSEFERILLEDDNFHRDFYRIRLIGVSDLGYELEIYAFAKSTEFSEFVAMREGLLFEYLKVIDDLGVQIALPSHKNFVYRPDSEI